MSLWWLRSLRICHLWPGEPGKMVVMVSPSVRTRSTDVQGKQMMVAPSQEIHPSSSFVCACVVMTQLFITPWTVSPARLLCPWDFPGKNMEWVAVFLLQGIFPSQISNLCLLSLLHRQADYILLSHLVSPGSFFCIVLQWIGWCPPTLKRGIFIQSTDSFKCWPLPETLSHTHSETMFHQLSGHPLTQSSWPIKLTMSLRQFLTFTYYGFLALLLNLSLPYLK